MMRVPTHYGNAPSALLFAIASACVVVLIVGGLAVGTEWLLGLR